MACFSVVSATESFESSPVEGVTNLPTECGVITATDGALRISKQSARTGSNALHITGGKQEMRLDFAAPLTQDSLFTAWLERWSNSAPFHLELFAVDQEGKETRILEHKKQSAGSYNHQLQVEIPQGSVALLWRADTAADKGLLIDDMDLHSGPIELISAELRNPGSHPMMIKAPMNPAFSVKTVAKGLKEEREASLSMRVSPASAISCIELMYGNDLGTQFGDKKVVLATIQPDAQGVISFKGKLPVQPGDAYLWVSPRLTDQAPVGELVTFSDVQLELDGVKVAQAEPISQRVGYMVAVAGDVVRQVDGTIRQSKHYRIPGLITTNTGTMVGCYDARYNHGGDLCADIDVAVVRSEDGGQTWSDQEVAMDAGEGVNNGCGDPCIVQDKQGRIWIQALTTHFGGGASLGVSKAGQDPASTGQWYMTFSDDDGKSWNHQYVNPTQQIKKDEWTCILAGPGNGIVLRDGTIVFPAQIWQNGAKIRCMSTICYSTDGGKNWAYGEGVPHSSSECQVVELQDGSIMINARNEARSGKRVVYTTKDLGKSWQPHSTNLNTLQEPVCQASLIAYDHPEHGRILLFSNPKNVPGVRSKLTIRVSYDDGATWTEGYEYDARRGAGYSSMAMVDKDHVGVFYESSMGHEPSATKLSISFIKIPLKDILEAK